jgi:glycosyltransferase involved in cell wall biosynthesis
VRVLVIAPHPFFEERGTPIAVRAVLETLSELGHELHVLTYHIGQDLQVPNCHVHRIPRIPGVSEVPPGLSFKKLLCDAVLSAKCLKLVRQIDFDLIHAMEEAAFLAMIVKRMRGTPYVYDMDSALALQALEKWPPLKVFRPLMIWLERLAIRDSFAVLAVCRLLEERALAAAPGTLVERLEDMSTLPHAMPPTEDLRGELGFSGPIVLYVGNLERYQGIDLLLSAFGQIVNQLSDVHLVLIGGRSEHIRHYSKRARQLGIDQRTHFVGPKPHAFLKGYLVQADVLASPRISGINTPMKIYSYLDSGTPVLATRLPTHTQVLDDEIAFLAEPTAEGLAESLLSVFSDEDRRSKIAAEARVRVRDEYSREAFQRKLGRFYARLQEELGEAATI